MRVCSFEISKALHQLNYDGQAYNWYNEAGILKYSNLVYTDVAAPRLDDAAYFLHESFGFGIFPYSVSQTSSSCYINGDFQLTRSKWIVRSAPELLKELFRSYEDALESAITKAVSLILNSLSHE